MTDRNGFVHPKPIYLFFVAFLILHAAPLSAGTSCITDADCTDPSLPECNMDTMMCEAAAAGCSSDADCTDPSLPKCNFVTMTCEAVPPPCSSDLDCTDPSKPVCNTDTMMCEAGPAQCLTDADCTDPSMPHCNTETMFCEALPAGCSSNADCLNPSAPYCNFDTQICQADVINRLFGLITDRADETIQVHPVHVILLDPGTGAPVGESTTNLADGYWEIYDLPAGQYKVWFDAHDAADVYQDELYPFVPCDDGGCDEATEGAAIEVAAGDNELNYDLPRTYSLSGFVLTELAQPIPGAEIRIYDADGQPLGTATAEGQGEWTYPRVPNGTYFARTVPTSIAGYSAELYDDVLCYSCDIILLGDPIVVDEGDVNGIDFILGPEQPRVFEDGFEDLP